MLQTATRKIPRRIDLDKPQERGFALVGFLTFNSVNLHLLSSTMYENHACAYNGCIHDNPWHNQIELIYLPDFTTNCFERSFRLFSTDFERTAEVRQRPHHLNAYHQFGYSYL